MNIFVVLKVLFVHDCASVCHDIAPHLNDLGIETEFLKLAPVRKMASSIRKSKADLVHANYIRSPAYAAFLSGKKYVLHAHGDDIRYGLSFLQKVSIWRSSLNLFDTEDISGIIKGSKLLPRPVDMNRFYPRAEPEERKAVYFMTTTSDPRLRKNESNYIEKMKDYNVTIVPSMTSIPYEQMPEFLSQFSLLFDKQFPETEYSKLALECMAMKIEVYKKELNYQSPDENYEYVKENHNSRRVAEKLRDYYREFEQ